MSRRPADLNAAARFPSSRDIVWAEIRRKRQFTLLDLEDHTRINLATLQEYVVGLEAAGYLRRIEEGNFGRQPGGKYPKAKWELIRDVGVDAPRVRADGTEVTQGRAREQMWRSMRILGRFTVQDLVVAATTEECAVKEVDAKSYVAYLARAGYLRVIAHGGPRRPAHYQFVPARYTGPKPPMVQRTHRVFDPNTGKVVWPTKSGEVS